MERELRQLICLFVFFYPAISLLLPFIFIFYMKMSQSNSLFVFMYLAISLFLLFFHIVYENKSIPLLVNLFPSSKSSFCPQFHTQQETGPPKRIPTSQIYTTPSNTASATEHPTHNKCRHIVLFVRRKTNVMCLFQVALPAFRQYCLLRVFPFSVIVTIVLSFVI